MRMTAEEPIYFTGIEDRSFTSKEDGRAIQYFRYNFIMDDESGTPMHFGCEKPLLAQGLKRLELCYPSVELTYSSNGAPRVKLISIEVPRNDVE